MTRRAIIALCAAAATALTLAACGADQTTTGASPTSAASSAKSTLPVDLPGGPQRALGANTAQANQLVGEGAGDLKTRLAALRGHPVA